MPKADTDTTTRTPEPPAARDAVMLSLCTLSTPEIWASRAPTSKAMTVVKEVADRLGGLSNVTYGLAFAEIAKRRTSGTDALRSELYFIAKLARDLADHLDRAHGVWWESVNEVGKPSHRPKHKV